MDTQFHLDGNGVLIPREGGYISRLSIELDKLAESGRIAERAIIVEDVIAGARWLFSPYTLDVEEVAWWSACEIGQRLCPKFDDAPESETRAPRVFIAGDARHCQSPKAGQGMKVSMQDSFNPGRKLAAVLLGRSPPSPHSSY